MTHDERIATLEQLGYGPRQAAFLALVMLHGGYFVRRQVASFLNRRDGGVATAFLRTLVRRRHARVGVYRRRTHVYHVFARRLYAAVGEEHNRNRREVAPAEIVRKVMTVDLVLHAPHAQWLATEREKVVYLTGRCGVPLGVLPATWYGSQTDVFGGVVRYCVDKALLFVTPLDDTVSVAYVLSLDTTLTGFQSFLDTYTRLLSALPRALVVLCSPDPWGCDRAEQVMANWRRTAPARQAAMAARLRSELGIYYEARQRLELGGAYALEAVRWAVRQRQALAAVPRFDGLYDRWRAYGQPAIDQRLSLEPRVDVSHVRFSSRVFPHQYGLFGTALEPTHRRQHPRSGPRRTPIDFAGSCAAKAARRRPQRQRRFSPGAPFAPGISRD